MLAGSDNPEGAGALVDFLLDERFQEALPESMYVYPVDDRVGLPPLWARWADPASTPITVPVDEISANRDDWLRRGSDVATG